MLLSLFKALEQSGMAETLRSNGYLYQVVEVSHYFFMFALIGSVAVTDFRVLGWPKRRESAGQATAQLFPCTWISLLVVCFTGVLLMMPTAVDMYENHALRIKMLLILLALIAHALLQYALGKAPEVNGTGMAKMAAVLSLVLWVSTILGGTEIAFNPPHIG